MGEHVDALTLKKLASDMLRQAVHVILNPKSGGGRAGRLRVEIVRQLAARGVDVVMNETRAPGHARELAFASARGGVRMVVAAGGDGTIHDVANGLLSSGTRTPIAIIPAGTGNDFAKIVPGARTRAEAYDTIARPFVKELDAGYAEWAGGSEFFANGMGTGIDVEVVRQIGRTPGLPGPIKYLAGLLRALAIYRPITLRATLSNEVLERSVMMFAVGNGVCQGGGFYLTPGAHPDDGVLDLCVLDENPLWRVPFILPLIMRGTHERHPKVTMRSFQRVRFETVDARPLIFQLDGELREPNSHWVNVEVRPRALPVVVRG